MIASDWLVWQIADSAFPTGGFAHSGGLEAAWHYGRVKNGDDVAAFIRSGLRQCSRGLLGFVQSTFNDSQSFAEIDRRCDLFLNNHVANRASRSQGRAFLTSSSRIFPIPLTIDLLSQGRREQSPLHLAPVFGLVCASQNFSESQTKKLFLFVFARGCVSSAVRLGIIGPIEAQQIQAALAMQDESEIATANETAVQTAPLLDLLQATQDRLYSRLFQS